MVCHATDEHHRLLTAEDGPPSILSDGPRSVLSEGCQDMLQPPLFLVNLLKKRAANITREEFSDLLRARDLLCIDASRYTDSEQWLTKIDRLVKRCAKVTNAEQWRVARVKHTFATGCSERICKFCKSPVVYKLDHTFAKHLLTKHSGQLERTTLPPATCDETAVDATPSESKRAGLVEQETVATESAPLPETASDTPHPKANSTGRLEVCRLPELSHADHFLVGQLPGMSEASQLEMGYRLPGTSQLEVGHKLPRTSPASQSEVDQLPGPTNARQLVAFVPPKHRRPIVRIDRDELNIALDSIMFNEEVDDSTLPALDDQAISDILAALNQEGLSVERTDPSQLQRPPSEAGPLGPKEDDLLQSTAHPLQSGDAQSGVAVTDVAITSPVDTPRPDVDPAVVEMCSEVRVHREEVVVTTARPSNEVCTTTSHGRGRSVKRLPSRWCQKSGPPAGGALGVPTERQVPRTAAQLKAMVRKIDTRGDANATVKLRHLMGSPIAAGGKGGEIDFSNHLAAYRRITGGAKAIPAIERKKLTAGLKGFIQFKSFLDKASASMRNASSFLNDYTRFSKTDVRKVLTLMLRGYGFQGSVVFTECFQENVNLFLMNFVAKLGVNMCLLAGCTKRTSSNNSDLGILQAIESNYGNMNCDLTLSVNHMAVNGAVPSCDRIHKCIFHYLFLQLPNKPKTLDELVQLMNEQDSAILNLYRTKVVRNGFDTLRVVVYRFLDSVSRNLHANLAERVVDLEEDPISWSYFKAVFNPSLYEFTSCVVHTMDFCNAENLTEMDRGDGDSSSSRQRSVGGEGVEVEPVRGGDRRNLKRVSEDESSLGQLATGGFPKRCKPTHGIARKSIRLPKSNAWVNHSSDDTGEDSG